MSKRFNSILVPVDFTENTDIAVSRALSMSNSDGCIIHLLHVHQIRHNNVFQYLKQLFSGYSWKQVRNGISDSEMKLMHLKNSIESARQDIKVYISVCYGETVENMISKKAMNLGVDLVVLGKHSRHSSLPHLNTVIPSRIALSSGIPVLTVKPGSLYNTVKKVVIPVGVDYPFNKLSIMKALQNEPGLEIMLVVFPSNTSNKSYYKQALLSTFRALKSYSSTPVKYKVLQGKNRARALANYCMRTEADMLIVHPGSETRVGSWINSHISDLLPASSRTQILAVKER